MAIRELLDQGLSREEAIRFAIQELGMTEPQAHFTLALELGEIDSDIEPQDEDQS